MTVPKNDAFTFFSFILYSRLFTDFLQVFKNYNLIFFQVLNSEFHVFDNFMKWLFLS